MRVAVTGANGFIGKRFIECYSSYFSDCIALTRNIAPLDDQERILEATKDIDVLVHSAFDHYYECNQIGLDNIILACRKNNIKRLIFISSVSVYDPNITGILSEDSTYSSYLDPYSLEKKTLENKLENQPFEVIILQPGIVYGIGGNWTNFAIRACKHKCIRLPNNGEYPCNAIYIDDVASAILKACYLPDINSVKLLISNADKISWKDFYSIHNKLLIELDLPANLNIMSTRNEFHDSSFVNAIFTAWYKTPIGYVFNSLIKYIKLWREKRILRKSKDRRALFLELLNNTELSTIGITRKVHQSQFNIDTTKAEDIISFKAYISLEDAFNLMLKELK